MVVSSAEEELWLRCASTTCKYEYGYVVERREGESESESESIHPTSINCDRPCMRYLKQGT